MAVNGHGKALRMRRLSAGNDQKHLFVPLDHSVSDGPVTDQSHWDGLINDIATGGADALIVHKGRLRSIDPAVLGDCGLIVHLSAGTVHAPDRDRKVLVGDVEEALELGADAVSVHVNVGSATESEQLADLGRVGAACSRWNVPLLAMIYPRGPRILDPYEATVLAHVVNIAADLGADLVKTNMACPGERMGEVTSRCPIPVLAAGGAENGKDPLELAYAAMASGCRGLAVGRRVFTSPSPLTLVRQLSHAIHQGRFDIPIVDSSTQRADVA